MKLPTFLPPSDAALVRGALRDEPRAFERLVARYQRRAHAVARAAGVAESATDDAVQEAFIRAFRHLRDLEAPESFGAWFLHIVRNAARDVLRAERRRVSWSEEAELRALGEDRLHPLEEDELKELLWRKVAELPAPVREAIFLYYHEGESVRTVARALGASRSAILKRLERGRAMLRERLWRKLEDSVRGSVPSERQWRQKARRLAILLASGAAGSWTARASAAGGGSCAGAAGGAGAWGLKGTLLGGLEMSGRKYAVAAILGAVILGGGWVLVGGWTGRNAPGPGGRRGTEPALAGAPAREDARPASGVEETGGATAKDAPAPAARSPGLFGRVTGPGGSPIRDARVLAVESSALAAVADRAGKLFANERGDLSAGIRSAAEELRGMAAWLRESRTDAAGEYRLEGLFPGEYSVLATHVEHLPRSDGWAIVQDGEPARCDIELSPAWRISGRVRDEEGRPAGGAALVLVPSRNRGLDEDARRNGILAAVMEGGLLLASGSAASAPDGAFSLGSLAPEPHDLVARKDGFAPARLHDIPAGKTGVEVILRRGLVIRGRVLSPEKKPIGGASVTLAEDSPERPRSSFVGEVVEHSTVPASIAFVEGDALRATISDPSGRFQLDGLAPGSFALGVSRQGYPAFGKDIRLEEASLDVGDIVLDPPRAISGRVLAPGGEPCAGARVWIEDRTRTGLSGWGGRASRASILVESRTGPDGAFSLGPLPQGRFAVRVSTARFTPATARGIAPGSEPIELRLAEGMGIRGMVVDARDGSPVEGARIAVGRGLFFDADPEKDAMSGPGGIFSVDGIAPGEEQVKLSVTHPAYSGGGAEIALEGTRAHDTVKVELRRLDRIRGRVLDAAGNPAAGARVRCEIPGWKPFLLVRALGPASSAISGPDGSFELEVSEEVRSPHWTLEVAASHGSLGTGRSALASPGRGESWPEVDVLLAPASSVRGKVRDAGGIPIRGAIVTARRCGASGATGEYGAARTAVTDATGSYFVRGIEPGIHDVEARAQHHAPRVERGVEVGADSRELDLVLLAGISFEGRVVDTSGNPVAGAEVFALHAEPSDVSDDAGTSHRRDERRERKSGIATARTDESGRYQLSHLPEEEITLVARAPLSEPSDLQIVRPGEQPADLVLSRLSSLEGIVVDSETGSPVPWFEVHLRVETARGEKDLIPREFIDPSGAFRIEGLFSGRAIAGVRARGHAPRFQEVDLPAGADAALRFELERGKTLQGTITDLDTGAPVEHARVSCHPRGDSPGRRLVTASGLLAWTDSTGAFSAPGLEPGKYSVHVYHPGYRQETDGLKVTIAEDANDPVRIGMLPAGSLEGKISNLEDSKSFDTRLELVSEEGNGEREHWTRVERHGGFQSTSIRPGVYQVRLRQSFFTKDMEGGQTILPEDVEEKVTRLGEVEIEAGKTTSFEARMP